MQAVKPRAFAVEISTFSGPFIPLQRGLLWYLCPLMVGIQTICPVFLPEEAVPVFFFAGAPEEALAAA